MSSILDIFQAKPVDPTKKEPKELKPYLPEVEEDNPIDIAPPSAEVDVELEMPELIDYGQYDLRIDPEQDFSFSSGILQDVPVIGVPINAYRVLLGRYSFEYGAKDHISATTKHVIVRFPVAFRNGSIKQTTGADDRDYEWSGHIKTPNVHEDLKAIKNILDAGEPVDFFYLGQKKKVLFEEFDYKILDNCNATYDVKVTEYYPQKIKFIPVRVDPLIPDRWGLLVPPDDKDKDKDKCNCYPELKITKTSEKISKNYFSGPAVRRPYGINPSDMQDVFGDLTDWFQRHLYLWTLTNQDVWKNIIDHVTMLFLKDIRDKGRLNCLIALFQACPHLQDYFYKNLLMEYLSKGVYVDLDSKLNLGLRIAPVKLVYIDEHGNFVGGNRSDKEALSKIVTWFRLHSTKTTSEINVLLNSGTPCSDLFDLLTPSGTGVLSRERVTTLCRAFRSLLGIRQEEKDLGFPEMNDSSWDLGEILIGATEFTFYMPEIVFGEACDKWCSIHDDYYTGTGGTRKPGLGRGGTGGGGIGEGVIPI